MEGMYHDPFARTKQIDLLGDESFIISRYNPIEMMVDGSLPPCMFSRCYRAVFTLGLPMRRRSVRATIKQLWDQETVRCRISDFPDFPLRSVMLDIRVASQPWLNSNSYIAAHKGNHLQLYCEHAVAYAGHQAVWRDASPLTLEELSQLDAYGQDHGVSLGVSKNTLGHAEHWLKHPEYADLGEFTDVAERLQQGEPGPFSFCPSDERVGPLCDDLLRQQWRHFR